SHAIERQEEMRRFFNVGIVEDQFTRQEVEDGLLQLFESVPYDYFSFTAEDYVAFNEGSTTCTSESMASAHMGHCPKCGVIGRNNGPPDADPDEAVLVFPFECLNCGHEWSVQVEK